MKFTVDLKTPDALEDAIQRAVVNQAWSRISQGMTEEETEECKTLIAQTKKQCEKWFEYGECVTLEIDTEKDTCTVV